MHATSQSRRTSAGRQGTDPARRAKLRSRLIGVGLLAAALLTGVILVTTGSIFGSSPHSTSLLPKAGIAVDFGTSVTTDDPNAIGVDETTYGSPSDVNDPTAQALLKKLGVGYARLYVTLANPAQSTSKITCAAAGCDTALNMDQWVEAMDAAGEVPVGQIPDTLPAASAVAVIKHFSVAHGSAEPVLTWVIGNEPNASNESASTYDANFNTLAAAIHQAIPNVKLGGPGTLNFDQAFLQQFLAQCGSQVDFVDFHFYPAHETAAELVAGLSGLSQDLSTLQAMIKSAQPSRASSIAIHVGEWNFSADPSTLAQYAYTGFAGVLDADILGRILTAGADSLAWGSKNGPMSLLSGDYSPGSGPPAGYQSDSPLPLYEGISMFTGQGLFPRFGTKVVSATSNLSGVDAFASADPDEIVIVNTGAARKKVTVRGSAGSPDSAEVWLLDQTGAVAGPPVAAGTVHKKLSTMTFTINLPATSVTTLVLTNVKKS